MISSFSLRVPAAAAAMSTLIACACRSQAQPAGATPGSTPPTAPAQASRAPTNWLVVDSAARIAKLTLEVTASPGGSSALINGFRAGEARVIVPVAWTIQWDWHNRDTTSPHSLVVMVQREKIPLEGGRPSFSNAMTRLVTEGLAPGQTDRSSFEAEEAGWYWLMCGVPGHALKGEWMELRVDPEAKLPSVQVKRE